jgi:ATP-dependent DNA helicase RecQ
VSGTHDLSLPLPAPASTADAARDVLARVFGYPSFRGHQEEIVAHVARGGDALVLMPTGGGKSLCYQVPSLVRPGVGVVVSPLIALMRDQVEALRALGVRAAALNSSIPLPEANEIERAMIRGELDLVYVAPERLVGQRFLDLLDRCRIALFALDEAHCVSQWGHDFRPEYRQLAVLAERYPAVPRIALTATADQQTREDIVRELRLDDARRFVSSFDRPNITYRVAPKSSERRQLLAFIRDGHAEDAGIVYCMSRAKVDAVADWLRGEGFDAVPYHAGLPADVRAANQDRFVKGEGVIAVATVAFGMGIDKPNVRFVAHLDLPKSLEAYYQETGRAGRDGLPADAFLVYGLADAVQVRQLIEGSDAPDAAKRVERGKLDRLLGFCECASCRRQALLAYFGERLDAPCGNCDTCFEPVEAWDATVPAQMALSAVYRTGQRFGVGHLVDVLRGQSTEKTRQFGHDALKTFGVGRDLAKGEWQSVFRQLVATGLLAPDPEGHGGLVLGEGAREVLRGEREVRMRRDPAAATRKALGGGGGGSKRGTVELAGDDDRLWHALKALRLDLARSEGLPPYVIFHDATLLEMVRARPTTPAAMSRIPGVGARKLERYGDAFLAAIAAG